MKTGFVWLGIKATYRLLWTPHSIVEFHKKNPENFLTSWATSSFWRTTLQCVVSYFNNHVFPFLLVITAPRQQSDRLTTSQQGLNSCLQLQILLFTNTHTTALESVILLTNDSTRNPWRQGHETDHSPSYGVVLNADIFTLHVDLYTKSTRV